MSWITIGALLFKIKGLVVEKGVACWAEELAVIDGDSSAVLFSLKFYF